MHTPDGTLPIEAGEAQIQEGRFEEALETFEELLNREPDNRDARFNYGVAAAQVGRLESATEAFLTLLRSDPTDGAVLENVELLLRDASTHGPVAHFIASLSDGAMVSASDRRAAAMLGGLIDAQVSFRAAHAIVDITPSIAAGSAIPLQGRLPNGRYASDVESALKMQLFLLEDERMSKVLVVSADIFGFDSALVSAMRHSARQWGIPPEALILNAAHNMSAPGTVQGLPDEHGPFAPAYAKALVEAFHNALEPLHDRLQPCLIYSAQAKADDESNSRAAQRDPLQEDAAFPMLVVDALHSNSTFVAVTYGNLFGRATGKAVVSAGHAGRLRDALRDRRVGHGMYLSGATPTVDASGADVPVQGCASASEQDEAHASRLAQAVAEALERPVQMVRGPVFARRESFGVTPSGDVASAIVNSASNATELQFVGLGSHAGIITTPTKIDGELVRAMIGQEGMPENLFLLSYTNGFRDTLPTSTIGATGAQAVVSSVLDDWANPHEPNGYGRYHLMQDQGQAFFCLSTGRCGTQTLSQLLEAAPNARVYHHPRPYLIKETLEAYHGQLDLEQTFLQARSGILFDAWKDDLIFGELDHNMTPFAPMLAEELPEAKFLVLVRNPWGFVRSGMRRGYYRGHSWDAGRLRPENDHPDAQRWPEMTPFQKVCWLWNDTYRRIHDITSTLPDHRYKIVRFEDLVRDETTTRDVFDFLGLAGFEASDARAVLGKKLNRQVGGDFPRPEHWDRSLHEQLLAECRTGIEAFDYTGLTRRYMDEHDPMKSSHE